MFISSFQYISQKGRTSNLHGGGGGKSHAPQCWTHSRPCQLKGPEHIRTLFRKGINTFSALPTKGPEHIRNLFRKGINTFSTLPTKGPEHIRNLFRKGINTFSTLPTKGLKKGAGLYPLSTCPQAPSLSPARQTFRWFRKQEGMIHMQLQITISSKISSIVSYYYYSS